MTLFQSINLKGKIYPLKRIGGLPGHCTGLWRSRNKGNKHKKNIWDLHDDQKFCWDCNEEIKGRKFKKVYRPVKICLKCDNK
jgi:hypothetical protein